MKTEDPRRDNACPNCEGESVYTCGCCPDCGLQCMLAPDQCETRATDPAPAAHYIYPEDDEPWDCNDDEPFDCDDDSGDDDYDPYEE